MLKDIPDTLWFDLRKKGFDLIWLMGMWRRSDDSRKRAIRNPYLVDSFRSIKIPGGG